MEFLNEYAPHIGELFTWLANPDTTIPVIRLLQGLAAIVGAIISVFGFYKAWIYAESRQGELLTKFLSNEELKVVGARLAVKAIREKKSALKQDAPVIFTNRELNLALKQVRKRKFSAAEKLLNDAINRTHERETLAQEKAELHEKQRAMAHLLLGAIADSQSKNDQALAHFQSVLEINEDDTEALEYSALQLLKLGNPQGALSEFERLAEKAERAGDKLLLSRAYRGCGKAYESLPAPRYSNANVSYIAAIQAFPPDGPPLDIAYVHELRGLANFKIKNFTQAAKSLGESLNRYLNIEHGGTKDAVIAAGCVKRILDVQKQLKQAQASANSDGEAISSGSSPTFMGLAKNSGNQAADNSSGSERTN